MAWIELHQGLREHKKVFACADLLGISRVTMVGTLTSIWLWALDNAQDGSLEGVSNRTIARICDWKENKADLLVGALVETGWLDQNENGLEIHDWMDYAGKLMDRREKDRERKRNTGIRKNSAGIPAETTRNSCATVPNRTVPNRTINNIIGETAAPSPGNTRHFVPPTLDEVQAYCRERGNNVDAQRWYDHYTSNGWIVGRTKMKDWKAAVRTWERSGYNNGASKSGNIFLDIAREEGIV